MELFTKIIETKLLIVIIENQLFVPFKEITTIVFKEIPDMNWITFRFKGLDFEVHHHTQASRFGFEGSVINLRQKNFKGSEEDIKVHEEIMKKFANTLGGIMDTTGGGESLEGYEAEAQSNSFYVVQKLVLKGIKEEDIVEALEELEQQKDLIKKSNC